MRRLLMTAGAAALFVFIGCSGDETAAGLGETAGGAGSAGQAQGGQGGEAGSGIGGQAGSGVGGQAGSGNAQAACEQLSSVYCKRLDECTPTLMDIIYGDVATCMQRMTGPCVQVLALPDTTKTPAWTAQCATLLDATSCEQILTRLPPTECTPAAGARKAGATCADDGQCETSYCKYTAGCGVCAKKAAAGQSCNKDDDCERGTGCAVDKKCQPYGVLDGPCDLNHPCAGGLSCVGATTQAQGVCKMAGTGGQQCDSKEETKPGCNLLLGFFCNPYAAGGLCQELKLAKGGEPCGVVGASYAVCTSSAMCKLSSAYSGVCLSAAADGESCDGVDGPYCMPLSQCLNGKCVAPAPEACN